MTVLPFPARNTDPSTSVEAAHDTAGREVIRISLLRCYAKTMALSSHLSDAGLTDEEAMNEAGFDLADDGHRRRCSDLRTAGLISPVYEHGREIKRLNPRTGRNRMVCAITSTGIDLLDTLAGNHDE